MQRLAYLIAPLLAAGAAVAQAPVTEGGAIAFASFEAVATEPLASPDMSLVPEGRQADFEAALAEGPNFAGNATLVTWGCGTACQTGSLVAGDGSINLLPTTASVGFGYRSNSGLLVVNPPDDIREDAPGWLKTRFFVWHGTHFVEIDESGTTIDPLVGCGEAIRESRAAQYAAPPPEF